MECRIELVRKKQLTSHVVELGFRRPAALTYRPGQHIRLHHGNISRDYTPVSLPGEEIVRICVSPVARFSAYLSGCDTGAQFKASGPYGHFTYRPSDRPAVFIGTGTGVAPFAAFVRSGIFCDLILHGGRQTEDLIYQNTLKTGCRTYIPCITRAAADNTSFQGRVTDYLASRLSPDPYQFYLCGRREMILDAMDIIDERFPDARVFTERFT